MSQGEGYQPIWEHDHKISETLTRRLRLALVSGNYEGSTHAQEYVLQVRESGKWKTIEKFNSMSLLGSFLVMAGKENTRLKVELESCHSRQTRRRKCPICGCSHNKPPE